jgi:hypothetical protein
MESVGKLKERRTDMDERQNGGNNTKVTAGRTHLLKQTLRIHQLGMALDVGHGAHEADACRIQGGNDVAREAGRKVGRLLPVLGGDEDALLAVPDCVEKVLYASSSALSRPLPHSHVGVVRLRRHTSSA